jgi:hypothetical protein
MNINFLIWVDSTRVRTPLNIVNPYQEYAIEGRMYHLCRLEY